MKRIPTQRHIVRRLAADFWQALDDYPLLPLGIAIVLLLVVNS